MTLTIQDLRDWRACDIDERVAELRAVLPDVADEQPVPVETWWALPRSNALSCAWSLRCAEPKDEARRVAIEFAVRAARRVLPSVLDQHRAVSVAAIEAAEAVLASDTPETRAAGWEAMEAMVDMKIFGAAARVAAWAVRCAYRLDVNSAFDASWDAEKAARIATEVAVGSGVRPCAWIAAGRDGAVAELAAQKRDLLELAR